MGHVEHRAEAPASVRVYVLTVSDTRTLDTDTGGAAIASLLEEAGHAVAGREIVRDEPAEVRAKVGAQLDRDEVQAIITTGGTGISARDTSFEAIDALLEKRLDGFGELFRMLSYAKIGTSTMQSRALGGVAGGTYLFALPGSTGAVKDAWDDILVFQLDNRHRPCNLVELMPRLQEHLKPVTAG